MKKVLIMMFTLLLATGCQVNNNLSTEKKTYQNMIDKLQQASNKNFNKPVSYDIHVYIDKIVESEIMYSLIIDEPTESMNNISAIIIHDYPTKDIFPSIGIFDNKVNLIPDFIDVSSNYVKGITLTGYIPYEKDITTFKGTFKVLVEYEDELGNKIDDYYKYTIRQ